MKRMTKTERSEIGRLMNSLRKTKGARAKVMRPCPKCGQQYGARDMRYHIPQCEGGAK